MHLIPVSLPLRRHMALSPLARFRRLLKANAVLLVVAALFPPLAYAQVFSSEIQRFRAVTVNVPITHSGV